MKKKANMMNWAKEIFPYHRSLTGAGTLKTLLFIKKKINNKFKIKSVKSGKKVFDWKIPLEWSIKKATINYEGKKIIDINDNNLHILQYSKPFKGKLSYNKLKKHLYFIKKKPNAIPYVTSFYKKKWGFCISYNQYKKLKKTGNYDVHIDTKLTKGEMNYGEYFIKGKSKKEILIVSYVCHPSMANNELSGILLAMSLIQSLKKSKYSLRILLIPETIGAIYFIEKNLSHLRKNLIAGFNLTCIGDNGKFSIVKSINENTYADYLVKRIFNQKVTNFYSYLYRGSNERQFGCQNLDLPFVTISRTLYGKYNQYHTSEDNLNILSEKNLKKSLKKIITLINEIQENEIFVKKINCEPFLTKYKLIKSTNFSPGKMKKFNSDLLNVVAYLEKNKDLKVLSEILKIKRNKLNTIINILEKKGIIEKFI